MGKRSSFERRERDAYDTPLAAVLPLLPHLAEATKFVEPCAGRGDLTRHLESFGHNCVDAWDIEPGEAWIRTADATEARPSHPFEVFITNPPWTRPILHALIVALSSQAPTWLLYDADWMHTRQASPYLPRLRKIVSVGRVKWIPDSTMTGKDNAAWFLFDRQPIGTCQFYGR